MKFGSKRELDKKGKSLTTSSEFKSIVHRGGDCEKWMGGGRLLYIVFTWARWYVSDLTICETHNSSAYRFKKETFTYYDLDPGDSRNLMMCRQFTSDCDRLFLNPSHPPLPPSPQSRGSSPFSYLVFITVLSTNILEIRQYFGNLPIFWKSANILEIRHYFGNSPIFCKSANISPICLIFRKARRICEFA